MQSNNENWTTVIKPKTGWFDINLKEVWQYRDLLLLFVKRNISTMYKQTVLGPLWLVISPIISTIISTFVFGTIAGIEPDGQVPYFLFYMCGHTAWNYFATCLNGTSTTFVSNAAVFGKVYFPRLVTPISQVITSLLNFGIQLVMFLAFMAYFMISGGYAIVPNWWIVLIPILVIEMMALGLGFGVIISSLTTKYRDLTVLVSFGVSLWMYITPIIYSATDLSDKARNILLLNPMAPIVETFRYAFLGTGQIPFLHLGISGVTTFIVLSIGVVLFSRVEKTFMDTV